jgi:4-hydroxybenzoate polyprenyltransferase
MTRERIIDLLAMSRFANLPTVWSNGLLGVLLGLGLYPDRAVINPLSLILTGLALSCLYLGGCFYNDWHDVDFDESTRPDRPIPSGRWKRSTIFLLAFALMAGGLILAIVVSRPCGLFAGGIIVCILAYTRWHKIHPASFLFMGGARALIYPMSACSLVTWNGFVNPKGDPILFFSLYGLGLGCYILGISLTARAETSTDPGSEAKKNLPVAFLCAPILFFSVPLLLAKQGMALPPLLLFIAILAMIVRSLRANHNVGAFVSRTLAAIPLADYLLVFPLAPHISLWVVCPLLALAALGLQKIAPAT